MENTATMQPSPCVAELYFLITKFLDASPCHQAAEVLKQELERLQILPKRLDWQGNEHEQTFNELERKYPHIGPNHLLEICRRLGPLLDQYLKPSLPGLTSMLGAGRQSLLRMHKDQSAQNMSIVSYGVRNRGCPPINPVGGIRHHNLVKVLMGREISGPLKRRQAMSPELYSKIQLYCRTLGHLSAVYCLLFDRSGKFIVTGADDLLVKIWSARDGRLLATLRGASSEITDIAVNLENTLLAAGSLDKILRVWSLQTASPIATLTTGHGGMITSVHFCPMIRCCKSYLVTTSTDGSVTFWPYLMEDTRKYIFHHAPIQYNERMRPGQAQMICAAFSPGGMFLATGCADHHIRIYLMGNTNEDEEDNAPVKILEIEGHADRVDSLQWAHSGLKFITGSKDGTAQVWQFKCQEWHPLKLVMSTKLPGSSDPPVDPKTKLRVSMVCWNTNDQFVITAVSDYTIKVWNPSTGELVQVLKAHKDEVFVLESHPFEADVLLSAGHDGQLIIWDIISGTEVVSFQNAIEGQGHGALFDAKWSPDGTMLAASDSHGHILIFGFGRGNEKFHVLPKEMFFHTDYRPLLRDYSHNVWDEQTQICPHMMPPPFLVDIDGNPYPPPLQRLVPGRENFQGDQLIPNVAWSGGGHQEVIEGLSGQAGEDAPADHHPLPRRVFPVAQSGTTSHRFGHRRNGDVEGIRHSSGNWQHDRDFCCNRRLLAELLTLDKLHALIERRHAYSKLDVQEYLLELCRRPPNPVPQPVTVTTAKRIRTVRTRLLHNYRTRAAQEQSRDSENPDATASQSSTTDQNNDDSTAREEDLSSSSSSDTESTEYSDWVADAGVNLEPPKRSPVRRRTQSAQASNKPIRPRKKVFPNVNNLSDVPEALRPTEWLSEIIPRKAPYYPQMGDEIVYFRQGHQRYLNAVRNKNLYELGNRCEPWTKQSIRAHELVKVIGIKYEIRPPRLCCLKLGLMNPDGRLTGENFTIKYHDMPDVLDFLVLKQTYDTAVTRDWRVGDRFRCMIDDSWWMGIIESQSPLEQEFPDSQFMCYRVRWDNGEYEHMSPWDMEPINEDRLPRITGGAVPVLPEEIEATLYQPQPEEWPMGDRNWACRRILAGLDQIMGLSIAEPFIAPVDLNQYPSYAYVVEYPIDLSTIKGRFENRFYRRVTSAQFDVRYIATNAEKFNEPGSQIVKKARIVTELCLRVITDQHSLNIHALYHQLMDAYESSQSEYEVDLNEPGTSNGRRRSNRLTRKRNLEVLFNSGKAKDWQSECGQLLEMMWQCADSAPFREPVNPLEHPDYHHIIDTPMDLRTVKEDLLGGNYQTPLEFCKDVTLIFSNSKLYNTNKISRIYCMTVRLSAMFEEHMKNIIKNWKSTKRHEQAGKRVAEAEANSQKSVTGMTTRGATHSWRAVNGPGPSREVNNESEDSDSDSESEGEIQEIARKPVTRKTSAHKKDPVAETVANGHSKSTTQPAIRLKINMQNVKSTSDSDSDSKSNSSSDDQVTSARASGSRISCVRVRSSRVAGATVNDGCRSVSSGAPGAPSAGTGSSIGSGTAVGADAGISTGAHTAASAGTDAGDHAATSAGTRATAGTGAGTHAAAGTGVRAGAHTSADVDIVTDKSDAPVSCGKNNNSNSSSSSSSSAGSSSSSSSNGSGSTVSSSSSSSSNSGSSASSSESTNKSNSPSNSTVSNRKKKSSSDRKNNNVKKDSISIPLSRKPPSLCVSKRTMPPRGKKRTRTTDSDDESRPIRATTSAASVRTRNQGRQRVHYQDQLSDIDQGVESDSESATVPIATLRKLSRKSVVHYREESEDSDNRVEPRRSTRPRKRRYIDDGNKSDGGSSGGAGEVQHTDEGADADEMQRSSRGTDGMRRLRRPVQRTPIRRPRRRAVSLAHYAEDSDAESSDDTPAVSVSSRGRVRKLTPRVRALFAK